MSRDVYIRPRDTHDEWRDLNVAFAPPEPVSYTVKNLTIAPIPMSEACEAARKVLDIFFREHQRRIEEAFFMNALRSGAERVDPFANSVYARQAIVICPPT